MNLKDSPFPAERTPASDYRMRLAQALARSCPIPLGQSLAVTGSTARGLADDESDLEINFWVDDLPGHDERADWLSSMGLRDPVVHFKPRADQSVWISGRFQGVGLEAGWQTFKALENCLIPILDGQVVERKPLMLAELVSSAVILRDDGRIAAWQSRLNNQYPAALRSQLYEDALKRLNNAEWLATERRLALRGEKLALVEMLRDDLAVMLRLLYAINGRWEAGQKWTLTLASGLPIMPSDWRARIDAVFAAQPTASVELCRELLAEAVDLFTLPDEIS